MLAISKAEPASTSCPFEEAELVRSPGLVAVVIITASPQRFLVEIFNYY